MLLDLCIYGVELVGEVWGSLVKFGEIGMGLAGTAWRRWWTTRTQWRETLG